MYRRSECGVWVVPDYRHEANEWADVATSALVWLRNIGDGISTPRQAIENIETGIAHCREVHSAIMNHSEHNLDMVTDGYKLVPFAVQKSSSTTS